MDDNADGDVAKDELLEYCSNNGLNLTHFETAFEEIIHGENLRGNRAFDRSRAKLHTRCVHHDTCQQQLSSDNLVENETHLRARAASLDSYEAMHPELRVDLHDFMEHFMDILYQRRSEFQIRQNEKAKRRQREARKLRSSMQFDEDKSSIDAAQSFKSGSQSVNPVFELDDVDKDGCSSCPVESHELTL